jgi:hypothetical protein
VLAQLRRQKADLMGLVRLGRPVGHVVRPGEDGVLRHDVDDVAAEALGDHRRRRGLGDEEAALGHDVVLAIPLRLGGLEQRLGDGQPGVVDHQVDPAEGEHRPVDGLGDQPRVGHVDPDTQRDVGPADLRRRRPRPFHVEVGHDHARPLRGEPGRDGPADAAGGARDQGDAPGMPFRCGQPPELGLLERPVLDPELLALRDWAVG